MIMRQIIGSLSITAALLASSACATTAQQQAVTAGSAEEQAAVLAVVAQLFDAMRSRDTASLAAVFDPSARFYGVGRNGEVTVTMPASFVQSIASAPEGVVLDEVLHDTEVRVDGPLATVWTYYDFFAGGEFSHCGYDAMQLLKTDGAWKIVALADTRRREGCRSS